MERIFLRFILTMQDKSMSLIIIGTPFNVHADFDHIPEKINSMLSVSAGDEMEVKLLSKHL